MDGSAEGPLEKYQAFHDDISKSVRAASKAYDSDSTVANELIEHKGYLNSRIDDLYAELKRALATLQLLRPSALTRIALC